MCLVPISNDNGIQSPVALDLGATDMGLGLGEDVRSKPSLFGPWKKVMCTVGRSPQDRRENMTSRSDETAQRPGTS
jgi:hypothetical protein